MIPRLLVPPTRSFFLFGPRGTGKSRWLAECFAGAATFDLLDDALLMELLSDPAAFARKLDPFHAGDWVVIDEVQRAPALLNTVHRFIEKRTIGALAGLARRILVYGSSDSWRTEGRIEVMSLQRFSAALEQGL